MRLTFERSLADKYTSLSQKARVLTENWVYGQVYCPNCGQTHLEQYESGRKVADFYCSSCREEYELKSKKTTIGYRIADGAYGAKIERLTCSTNPSLFVLNYDSTNLTVNDLMVVPKHFFTPEIIERRKALSASARRAGWVGSNILLKDVPESGRLYIVRNGVVTPKADVMAIWRRTLFLREENDMKSRGWLMDIMALVEKLGQEFTLGQLYTFEGNLERKHPDNRHIRDKIRQQLQVLRDRGYLEFVERGRYRLKQHD
ncbi:DpnI domain-containing protein [Dehalogenimonas sp. THU2]|uniref:DpnI domain-containing protein n=1 Tax=Dehalogenimonas sp. THU2 TaxID=3151121 RepID=UPI0032184F0E